MAGKSKNSKKVRSSEDDETLIAAASTESSELQEVEDEQLPEEEPQEQEPQWDIIKVIDQAKEEPCFCRNENCESRAVAVWQSTDDPQGEDAWPLCKPCQLAHFGEEEPTGGAAVSGLVDSETQPTEAESSGTLASDATMTEAADGEDEHWDLKKIISKQEITEFPIQCEDDGCKLYAAVVWVKTNNPDEKWRGCLDCQVRTVFFLNACAPFCFCTRLVSLLFYRG